MFARQIGWLAALMLLVPSAASAGSLTASFQVSLLITESCGVVTTLSSGTDLPVEPSQVSVKCAFRAPHVVRAVRETTQSGGDSDRSQGARAAAVTTLEF